ncbi:MAG: hypothetical protein FJ088_14775, partial [Deltaproteobacteria bacterium]|nr:hypothetical protein [Deltaproteobacteria bacterium]
MFVFACPNLSADTSIGLGNFILRFPGEYRFSAGTLTAMDVETVNPAAADKIPEETYGEHRLLFMPQISGSFDDSFLRKIALVSEIQLLSGSLAGDFAGRGLLG